MKQSMIALLLACCALLAACGAEDDASSQQAASSQAESASSQSAEEKQTVTGTIVDGTMHTIAIETAGRYTYYTIRIGKTETTAAAGGGVGG